MPGGVTLVQFLPASRGISTSPSSEPVQITPGSFLEGAMVKIVANTSGPFMSCVIGPPESPRVAGSCLVRSPLIFVQLWPSFVVFHKCCDDVYRMCGSKLSKTIG